jgi:plastocyanin
MRRLISLIAIASALTLATSVVVARAPDQVLTTGDERVVPNAMVQATLRFTPGMIQVASDNELTWTDIDEQQAPHTATIVEEFPDSTLEAIFGCVPCAAALAAHGASGPVVDVGAQGFDEPGDSLLFGDSQEISAEVTAPAGTKLKYLCAIHPWMQGEIVVK